MKHLTDRWGTTLCGSPQGEGKKCLECEDIARRHPFLTLSKEDAQNFVAGLKVTGGNRG